MIVRTELTSPPQSHFLTGVKIDGVQAGVEAITNVAAYDASTPARHFARSLDDLLTPDQARRAHFDAFRIAIDTVETGHTMPTPPRRERSSSVGSSDPEREDDKPAAANTVHQSMALSVLSASPRPRVPLRRLTRKRHEAL